VAVRDAAAVERLTTALAAALSAAHAGDDAA
jgi:hypothetical protein